MKAPEVDTFIATAYFYKVLKIIMYVFSYNLIVMATWSDKTSPITKVKLRLSLIVTGPEKTGLIYIKYTYSYYRPYLSFYTLYVF